MDRLHVLEFRKLLFLFGNQRIKVAGRASREESAFFEVLGAAQWFCEPADPVALQQLRDELFTPDEQKRLRAYE